MESLWFQISRIIKKSKINLVVVNSEFVLALWKKYFANICIIVKELASPSPANRMKKECKILNWHKEIDPYLLITPK